MLQHGWPGFPALAHLALNTFLILEAGRPCERLLGSRRFLLLCVLSAAANAVTQVLFEGVNGSSLVIWSWGPALFLGLRAASGRHLRGGRDGTVSTLFPDRQRIKAVLAVMYVAVTLVLPLVPYALGWRGNPLYALVMANIYHLTATAVGLVMAWLWRRDIREQVLRASPAG